MALKMGKRQEMDIISAEYEKEKAAIAKVYLKVQRLINKLKERFSKRKDKMLSNEMEDMVLT
jgi:ribosome-associated translation inhibitor RaiA